MSPQIKISITINEDAYDLATFMNEIIDENLPYIFPFPERFTDEIQLKHIKAFTDTENAFLLVAKLKGEIIGALDLMPHSSLSMNHIGKIGVLVKKQHRSQGVGLALYRSLVKLLKDTSLKKIEAQIFSSNTKSIHLHLKMGFEIEKDRSKQLQLQNGLIAEVLMLTKGYPFSFK